MTVKGIVLTLCFLFCSGFVNAQNNCQTEGSFTMCTQYQVAGATGALSGYNLPLITATDQIAYAASHNVWHAESIAAATHISSSFGVTYFTNSSGQLCAFHEGAAATCNNIGWMGAYDVAVQDATHIYGIGIVDTYCGSERYVWVWTGSGNATQLNTCMTTLSVAPNGTLFGTRLNHQAFKSVDGGNTWTFVGNGWLSIHAVSDSVLLAIKCASTYCNQPGDETLWQSADGGNSWMQITVPEGLLKAASWNYFLGNDGYIYYLNNAGTSWTKLAGSGFTDIASGGSTNTFAVGPTQGGYNVYRFPNKSITLSSTLSGYTVCSPSPCPSGATHQGIAEVAFTGNPGQTVYSPIVQADSQLSATAADTATDPFTCLESGFGSSSCLTTTTGGVVTCAALGSTIFQSPALPSLPCYIPKYWGIYSPAFNLHSGTWNAGASVNVYFNAASWTDGGACPAPKYCQYFLGIAGWTGINGITYNNKGTIPDPSSCLASGGFPCGMQFPFVLITKGATDQFGTDGVYTEPTGSPFAGKQWSYVLADPDYLTNPHDLESDGAHEAGHNLGLNNCRPDNFCTAAQTNTVMWYVLSPQNPAFPTWCDLIEAQIMGLLL